MSNLIRLFLLIPAIIFGFVGVASAAPDPETAYIFNSFSFLVHGFLVMLMAAGFCMLETGLVRAKNAVVQCAKNIGLYSIAGIMFAVVGYNLMYMDVSGYIGSFSIYFGVLEGWLLKWRKGQDFFWGFPGGLLASRREPSVRKI